MGLNRGTAVLRLRLFLPILVLLFSVISGSSGSEQSAKPAIHQGSPESFYPGDCNGDKSISIGEVQQGINGFLGSAPPACGADQDGNGLVSIGEVQKLINEFLGYLPQQELLGADHDFDGIPENVDGDLDYKLDNVEQFNVGEARSFDVTEHVNSFETGAIRI